MADIDSILNDWNDNDTQMDPTNGRESPVFAQTPQTKARETERTRKRGAIPPRRRGVGRIGRVRAATSSKSRSSTPPDTPVADSQRGRGRTRECEDRSQRAEARSAALDAATAALNTARENRATGTRSRSTSENTSSTPAAATVESRGRKRKSIIRNHCNQKVVDNTKITFCNH